ncbi:MAG: hypothetical protein HY403_05865 [Elusimicrobia bacterium]|nr:hypothetical protein [Elusimicrobiota bacterium]
MRKMWSLFAVGGLLAAALGCTASARAEDAKEAPESIVFDKAKLGPVKFPHKKHVETIGACDNCHGGKEPLFAQKKSEGMKMADMYAGKGCGYCHDGKKKQGDKVIFAAKGGCMKCHKKEAKGK